MFELSCLTKSEELIQSEEGDAKDSSQSTDLRETFKFCVEGLKFSKGIAALFIQSPYINSLIINIYLIYYYRMCCYKMNRIY